MPKYGLWRHRAQTGTNGYAVLYPSAASTARRAGRVPVAVPRAVPRRSPRAAAAARRRRALATLLVALGIPTLIALVTGSAAAWWVVVALLPVVCGYLAVMFHNRRLMAEREINMAFSGPAGRGLTGLEEMFSVPDGHGLEDLGAVSAGLR